MAKLLMTVLNRIQKDPGDSRPHSWLGPFSITPLSPPRPMAKETRVPTLVPGDSGCLLQQTHGREISIVPSPGTSMSQG